MPTRPRDDRAGSAGGDTSIRHAVITGGSSGIGLAAAEVLFRRGWSVSLLAVDRTMLDKAATKIADHAGSADRVHVEAVDVRDPVATEAAIHSAEAALGPCEALITSAGVALPARFDELDIDEFKRQMDVNLHGTVNAVRAVYGGMCDRGRGRIALISSAAGLLGIFGHSAYAPTKFAVRGFGEALRSEAKPHGISVTICYLPDTDTPQLRANAERKPAETKAISGAAGCWAADDIGKRIVDGMERGHARMLPGLTMLALAYLIGPLGPALNWRFDQTIRSIQSKAQP